MLHKFLFEVQAGPSYMITIYLGEQEFQTSREVPYDRVLFSIPIANHEILSRFVELTENWLRDFRKGVFDHLGDHPLNSDFAESLSKLLKQIQSVVEVDAWENELLR